IYKTHDSSAAEPARRFVECDKLVESAKAPMSAQIFSDTQNKTIAYAIHLIRAHYTSEIKKGQDQIDALKREIDHARKQAAINNLEISALRKELRGSDTDGVV